MMMLSPGVRVALNFPRRSTIHSSPCGTILTPFQIVTATNISIAMTTISKPIAPPSKPAHFQDVAFDVEHFHALTDLDLAVGDRFPRLVAQYRLLKADLSLFVRPNVPGHQADLADEAALGKPCHRLVETALENLEPEPDQYERNDGPDDDLVGEGERGKNYYRNADHHGCGTEPDQEKGRHRELEQHQDDAEYDPVPPQDFHAAPGKGNAQFSMLN